VANHVRLQMWRPLLRVRLRRSILIISSFFPFLVKFVENSGWLGFEGVERDEEVRI
jgi:hypothetical protein